MTQCMGHLLVNLGDVSERIKPLKLEDKSTNTLLKLYLALIKETIKPDNQREFYLALKDKTSDREYLLDMISGIFTIHSYSVN